MQSLKQKNSLDTKSKNKNLFYSRNRQVILIIDHFTRPNIPQPVLVNLQQGLLPFLQLESHVGSAFYPPLRNANPGYVNCPK
jgi:hypothetical protein